MIYLARHAQSAWQVVREDVNDTLTQMGHEQAARLARWLAEHERVDRGGRIRIARLLVSPLRRARETATYVSEAVGLQADMQDSLAEADFHVSDHLPVVNSPFEPHGAYEPSDAYDRFKQQARSALEELVKHSDAAGGPILAVTHGGLIKTLLRLIAGSDAMSFDVYNTGITALDWKRGRWHLVHLNLCDHLPPPLRTL